MDVAVTSYSDLNKSFNSSFELTVANGSLRKGEIIGLVGANALGKTTFMKMISGMEKPDLGSIQTDVKISYKPQYLSQEYEGDVKSVLAASQGNAIEGSLLEEQIVLPLGIKKLYEKSISHLSGGELQKIAVAASLMRPADIYALDEPSAFLDVEDRIALAKFLQRFVRAYGKSAMVIDHDVQIIDLVSDSLVIFQGVPGSSGHATVPLAKEVGMNNFLKSLSITYRRDLETGRPRVNKEGSRLDRGQKDSGNYYYIE